MASQPNSYFPLLASDQADVIRIYLELMGEGNHAERVSDVRTTNAPLEPRNDSNNSCFPSELLDLE
jgi:hypothetical protein